LSDRSVRLKVGIAGVALLFAGVAAFGTVKDVPPPIGEMVIEHLDLPSFASNNAAEPEVYWREERFERGDTFASFLNRLGVRSEDALTLVRQSGTAKTLRILKPGTSVQARTTADGDLLSLEFVSPQDTLVGVQREGDHFNNIEEQVPLTRVVKMSNGVIQSSLFAATDDAGLPDAVSTQLADIFSADIDFHRDLRGGDRFSVVYEVLYYDGRPVKSGHILGAQFTNNNKTYRAVWFENQAGKGGYYTPDGKNVRKAFLRSPLEFSRVTSGFAMRLHPLLGTWRQHRGVDYGAPTGTRVKATADGIVDFVGQQNGYGNVIILRHQGNVTTLYGHLNAFASGLHKGQHVSQSDVIGYVGSTGWATGPHLHYEYRVAGTYHDPLTVAMPAADSIPPQRLAAFKATARSIATQLNLVSNVNVASTD
jgi:murein DD-endopeptidase MepM/ murein hydrolase activator NlpD